MYPYFFPNSYASDPATP
uniref:Uncharacterized protein n=1 Tax=Anguilla anguilla TaxID=7936 RepID=A0A0E9UMZ8_ANGAN